MTDTERNTLHALYGVYNANGGLLGELAYVTGKLMKTAHCALCDITHGWVREKTTFTACRNTFSAPIHTVHINEQSDALANYTAERTPCVVAETDAGFVMLLDEEALEACNRSVDAFTHALNAALHAHELD